MTDQHDFELTCDGTILTRWLKRDKPCPERPRFAIVAHHATERCESVTQLFCADHAVWANQHYIPEILALAHANETEDDYMQCAQCAARIEVSDHIRTITEL